MYKYEGTLFLLLYLLFIITLLLIVFFLRGTHLTEAFFIKFSLHIYDLHVLNMDSLCDTRQRIKINYV